MPGYVKPPVNGRVNGAMEMVPSIHTQTPLTIKGTSGQTADIFEIKNSAGTDLFFVDKDGYVRAPTQPAFRYHGFSLVNAGMQGGTAPLNQGNHLSIGSGATYSRFTAPINGLYLIGISCLIEISTGRTELVLRKNGSSTIDGYDSYAANEDAGQYSTAENQFLLYLNANDYITVHQILGTLHGNLTRGDRQFWGYLVS